VPNRGLVAAGLREQGHKRPRSRQRYKYPTIASVHSSTAGEARRAPEPRERLDPGLDRNHLRSRPWRRRVGVGAGRDASERGGRHRERDPGAPPVTRGYLDTSGAQFRNVQTGERILVYSLQRWRGAPEFDSATGDLSGWDHRGRYRVELCAANSRPAVMPLELVGLAAKATCFGSGWADPTRRRSDGEAFRRIVAALRRHCGIWPLIGGGCRSAKGASTPDFGLSHAVMTGSIPVLRTTFCR
jgi:hypothetical protein